MRRAARAADTTRTAAHQAPPGVNDGGHDHVRARRSEDGPIDAVAAGRDVDAVA
jgi:hypothetical protein